MDKRVGRIRFTFTAMFVLAIALLSGPTLMVLFSSISKTWFITLNTIGLLIATIRIVLSLAISVSVVAVEGESSWFKKKMDQEAKLLFIATVVIQFINFMFIQFD